MAFSPSAALLDQASAGNSRALDSLLRDLLPHVERQLLRYPLSDEDRKDLVQNTLLQVVRRIGSFRGDSSFSTWLFRVTANEALMLMRSQRRHRARLVDPTEGEGAEALLIERATDDAESPDTRLENVARDEAIRAAIAELPEDYRNVVVAHYHLDLGLHEIAARFAVTESAVRSRLHRARVRLRELLGAQHEAASTPAGAVGSVPEQNDALASAVVTSLKVALGASAEATAQATEDMETPLAA
jgi:RNA polymerase sigma-70 factor (ECF subfamily)